MWWFCVGSLFCCVVVLSSLAIILLRKRAACFTVKSGHSIKEKPKILKTNGNLMKIKSIAECSLGAFCNTFDLY